MMNKKIYLYLVFILVLSSISFAYDIDSIMIYNSFDNGSASFDESGHNFAFTPSGDPGNENDSNCALDGCVFLDGNDYVSFNGANINNWMVENNNGWSMWGWAKASVSSNGWIIGLYDDTNIEFYQLSADKMLYLRAYDGAGWTATNTAAAYNDVLTFFCIYFDESNNTLTLSINDGTVLTYASGDYAQRSLSNGMAFGARGDTASTSGQMYLDEIGISNETFTFTDCQTMYNEGNGFNPFRAQPISFDLDLFFTNETGVEKNNFYPGEDFFISLNYSYSNSTPVDNGICNISLINGIIELDASDNNFTLCDTGCDYDPYQETFNPTINDVNTDVIHFDVCHEQTGTGDLNITVNCSSGSNSTIVSPGQIPLCSVSNGSLFIHDKTCISDTTVTVTLSSDVAFPQRKRIYDLNFDRSYDILTNVFNESVFYNTSSDLYFINHSWEYYMGGDQTIFANCTQSDGTNLENYSENITILVGPPEINIEEIIFNDSTVYLFNGTDDLVDYKLSTYTFAFFVSPTSVAQNITLHNKTHLVYSSTNTSLFTLPASQFRDFENNPFNFTITGVNAQGNKTTAQLNFTVGDLVNPTCTGLSDASVTNNTLYSWNVSCSDESFFSLNISCTNGKVFAVDGLNTKSYTYINSTNVTENINCSYEYCDGHTNNKIDFSKWGVVPTTNKITFSLKDSENTLLSPENADFFYIPEEDRIKIKVKWTDGAEKPRVLYYETSKNAYYFPSEEYKGWIVDPETKTWFDMNSAYEYDLTVTQWFGGCEDITGKECNPEKSIFMFQLDGQIEEIEFESIGELNCVSGSQVLTAVAPSVAVKPPLIRQFDNTREALTIIFMWCFWLLLVILTLTLKGTHGETIQLLNLIQVIFGFFAGLVTFPFSWVLAFLISLAAVGIFGGKIYDA